MRIIAVLLVALALSGCGYLLCRGFEGSHGFCSEECTYECERGENGSIVVDPESPTGACKIKVTCGVSVMRVLMP